MEGAISEFRNQGRHWGEGGKSTRGVYNSSNFVDYLRDTGTDAIFVEF